MLLRQAASGKYLALKSTSTESRRKQQPSIIVSAKIINGFGYCKPFFVLHIQ
jgi:hypothetical protein